jgi:uncharacterized protein
MRGGYIQRAIEPILERAVAEFPAVVLTGPRQAGKTTVLQHVFGARYRYVSVETPDVREAAALDPRGFLAAYAPPVILDEVQHVPDLLPYIKERIDADRSRPGQYLLTGSQNRLLVEKITESLAGRAAMLRLLPLSFREARDEPFAPLPWERGNRPVSHHSVAPLELWEGFLRGGYPELAARPGRDGHLWHASYVQTYLERDVRTVRQVGDLTQFQSFLRALAARSGQLLSLTDLARDLGVAVNTIKSWISVLEATYQIVVLRPYHANVGKRLVKTPKVYFTDTGTLCHLSGLRDPAHAAAGPLGGAIMETAVLTEVLRRLVHRGLDPELYFWRTSAGSEVDLVVRAAGKLIPIEVKLSATPRPPMAASVTSFQDDLGDAAAAGYVVHPGDIRLPLASGVTALPFCAL